MQPSLAHLENGGRWQQLVLQQVLAHVHDEARVTHLLRAHALERALAQKHHAALGAVRRQQQQPPLYSDL